MNKKQLPLSRWGSPVGNKDEGSAKTFYVLNVEQRRKKLGFYDFMIENCWFLNEISENPEMDRDRLDCNSAAHVLFQVHERRKATKKWML